MPHLQQTAPPYVRLVSSGIGAAFDPSALARLLDADPDRIEGAPWSRRSSGQVRSRASTTAFDDPRAVERLGFIGALPPRVSGQDGFVRITPHPEARTHGAWTEARGDGIYRALVRWSGADLPPSLERRICLGLGVSRYAGAYGGVRVDVWRTLEGAPRLGIREYIEDKARTVGLAMCAADWSQDAWHWIEAEVRGASVRARVYAEGTTAPDWRIRAETRRLGPGAYGPGAIPGQGLSPALDLRRLEFLPAVR